MKYLVKKDRIVFDKTEDFDAKAILECGQMFRFYMKENGYEVITANHLARIQESGDKVEIITKEPRVFVDFFDLDTDYGKIKKELSKYEILKDALSYGKGIRIARGDIKEVIISFIISQNNNIKRIQKIIEKLCELGEKIDDTHRAFPSMEVLASKDLEFYQSLGAGYRDVYLYEAARLLKDVNFEEISKLDDQALFKWLLSIKGVGPKVASCIMLFGFHRTSSFPVDTWIEKVYNNYFFVGKKTRPQISKFFEEKFGAMSGIVQQYLFYYQRELDKNKR